MTLVWLVGYVALLGAVPASAQTSARPASEKADRFVGTWVLDPAKSTFEGAPAQKSSMRTFDYERDGMILCTVHTTSDTGRPSFVHFLITLDGREHEELSRSSSGTTSPTYVSAKKVSEQQLDLTFKRDGQGLYLAHVDDFRRRQDVYREAKGHERPGAADAVRHGVRQAAVAQAALGAP